MTDSINPFSNGTQYMDWVLSNCDRCKKNGYDEDTWPTCEVHKGICLGAIEGYITDEIAERMGYTEAHADGKGPYVWPCKEYEQETA
jgi:hypothetical protein